MRNLMACTLYHLLLDDQIKKNEMGRACMGDRRGVYRVLMRKPEGRVHMQALGIDGRIKRTFMKWEAWQRLG